MNKEPVTYAELIRKKRCIELTNYYDLTEEDLDKIYTFLEENKKGIVRCGDQNIALVVNNDIKNATFIIASKISSSVDGIVMSNDAFKIIPHYEPSPYDGHSGGSSSNNNNNNNNNNNR